MQKSLSQRSNEEWIAALRGRAPDSSELLSELETYLHRMLRRVLHRRDDLTQHDFVDLTQEALLKLLEYLPTFRGDSAFTTWATSVATRVAFTELRKRSAREKGQRAFQQARADATRVPAIDLVVSDHQLHQALHEAIQAVLTERQKVAILAELRGIPTIEIATELGTNQNALYKLVHDARKKLRARLIASGFSEECLHRADEGVSK